MKRWAAAMAFLGLVLLALLPLRLALADSGLSARTVAGTLWGGSIAQAEWRGLPLGDLRLRIVPTALLTATARYRVDGPVVSGQLWRRSGGGGVADLRGRIVTGGLLPIPVAAVELSGVSIDWRGGCRSASGQVRVTLAGPAGTAGVEGSPQCDGSALRLPLISADGRTSLDLALQGQRWTARLRLANPPETQRAAALAAGLRPTPQGLVLEQEGTL